MKLIKTSGATDAALRLNILHLHWRLLEHVLQENTLSVSTLKYHV